MPLSLVNHNPLPSSLSLINHNPDHPDPDPDHLAPSRRGDASLPRQSQSTPLSPPLDSSLLLINHNPSAPLSLVKGRCHHSSQGGPHHREACHPMVLTGPHHREACQWYHPPRQWYHPPQGPPATHHTRLRLEWGQKLGDLVVHQVAIRFGRNQRTLPPGASGSEV